MNNGAFGENFPYSNFHDLNMDWIIKIAKDFLDQYSHIQEIIATGEETLQNLTSTGLEELENKTTELENLLQEWYDTHSEDIATQLANAIDDLDAWYNTHTGYLDSYLQESIDSFNSAADAKAAQTIASIPSDYTSFYNSAMVNRGLADATTASNLLVNVDMPGAYNVTAIQDYTDRPAGTTGGYTLVNTKITTVFTIQSLYSNQNVIRDVWYRVIRTTTHVEFNTWYRIDSGDYTENGFRPRGNPTASDYSGLVANIITAGGYNLDTSSQWTDLPSDMTGSTFLYNMPVSSAFRMQIVFSAGTARKAYYRVVRNSSGEVILTWNELDNQTLDSTLRNIIPYNRGNPTPADYSNTLANLDLPGGYNLGSLSNWDDAPEYNHSQGAFMYVFFVSTSFYNQIIYSTGLENRVWYRTVRASHNIYRNWREITSNNSIPNLKVLALGDSICRGGRNSGRGYAGLLDLPYINMGVGGATLSNLFSAYNDSIHHFPEADNIPNQLISYYTRSDSDIETAFGISKFTPDIIIAEGGINDYIKGSIELGTPTTGIVRSDTEANALDKSTIIGALEYLFYQMVKLYPSAQRAFLISHKTGRPNNDYYPTRTNGKGWTQADLHNAIVNCCDKYNVIVMDVYNDSVMNTGYSTYRSNQEDYHDASATDYCDYDGLHPLEYGYKQGYVPVIRHKLNLATEK